jgi:two-component system sensor histidine kinase PhoQ
VPDPAGVADAGKTPGLISLRARQIAIASIVMAAALVGVGLVLDSANHRAAVSALEGRMESYVYLALAAMEVTGDGGIVMDQDLADPRLSQPGSGIYLRIEGDADGWGSPSALGLQLPELPRAEPGQARFGTPGSGLDYFTYQYGIGWQMDDQRIEPFTVSVLAHPSGLEQQTSAFRAGLWRSLTVAGMIIVLAQFVILALGFRPLRQVARDVADIESGRADRLEGPYPSELEPLVRNVNRLLETEKSNQIRVRNALDSLAHSLKTPLAVIRAGLGRDDGSPGAVQNAVDEMNRLIATRLERAGASTRRTMAEPVAVGEQLQRVIASLRKVYSQKMIATEFTMEPGLNFYGEKRDLLELMGNLLDNAFKYGKTRVRVSGGANQPQATRPGLWLMVEDDGPGIEEAQWEQLLRRGVRGDERIEGHGLGLSIVMELATAYGGEVSIGRSGLGGAMITVSIPAS